MGSWRSGGLRVAATLVGAASVGGCAHGRARADEPTPAAAQACAGVAPLSVLVGGSVPETAVARGQALYCLALYEPALSVFVDQAIRKPVAVAIQEAIASPAPLEPAPLAVDRLPALRWLVYLHRRLPGSDRIKVAVGEIARADLERPELADVRDDLHALAARFEYERGSFDKAVELLRKVPASSSLHLPALLLEGAIHVRRGVTEPALAAFAEALRIAPAGADRDLAIISLARVYYATGQFETASRSYDRLPPPSPYWARAALEGAWTSFQLKDYPRALARVRTLAVARSDVPAETMAEAITIEAAVALYRCRRADFQQALARFNATYPVLFTEAKRQLRQSPEVLCDAVFSVRTGGAPPQSLDAGVMRQLLADTPVARRLEEVDELEREHTLYERLDAGWRASPQGDFVGTELARRRSAARREAGEQLHRRLQRLADELGTQIKQSIGIEVDASRWAPGVPSMDDAWSLCQPSQ